MSLDVMILWFNAILWLVTILGYVKYRSVNSLGFIVLALYTLISIVAIDTFQSIYSIGYFERNIKLFPFIYLFVMIMLIAFPLLRINEDRIFAVQLPNVRFLNLFCIAIIIFSLYSYIPILEQLPKGMIMLLSDSSYALDMYQDTTSANMDAKAFSGNVDLLGVFSTISKAISPLFFFIYLSIPKKKWPIILGLFVSMLADPLSGISSASRVLIVLPLSVAVFFFYFYKKFLNQRVRKIIWKIGIAFISIILSLFVIISIGRSDGDSERMNFQLERYFSESFIVFNNYCLDAGGIREGQRTFPLVCKILGNKVYSPMELRLKYSYMKVDSSRFSTFVGDFVLDFGPIVSFILFVFLSFILSNCLVLKNGCLKFYQLVVIYTIVRVILGFFQFTFSGVGGNVSLLFLILLTVYFRYLDLSNRKYFITVGRF